MRYGLSIPNFGDTFQPRTLADLARQAEDAGWDGFFLWDHVLFDSLPTADPWIALAAVALATERILIGPMVTPLPRRRITKLARETVTLDHLSHGRLILGVGSGIHEWELAQLGDTADAKQRGAMLDEGLALLNELWSGDPINHQGTHYTAQPMIESSGPGRFLPTPVQQPRIPIWVAGMWPNKPPFRRAARWDGVFPLAAQGSLDGPDLTPAHLRDLTAFTLAQRTATPPFDVVIAGVTPDPASARATTAAYEEAGATWWIEDISPWAFGWGDGQPWPTEAITARIRQGPPTK
ncbi:MAG: LLM class flavin-dependent oxidoreductase [Ktedonobacterales bacterium]|nr:LLM class flavin-dependent oxidoreductase [Ktedonobacterales bacterium]